MSTQLFRVVLPSNDDPDQECSGWFGPCISRMCTARELKKKKSSPESESSKLATSFDIHEGFKEEDVQVFGGTSEVLCQPLVSICIVRPAC